jgi:hypothetical protein
MSDYIATCDEQKDPQAVSDYTNDAKYTKLVEKLASFADIIATSDFFAESKKTLCRKFTQIRCLALGSPSQSNNALYQLAYLQELAKVLEVSHISVCDPVFSDMDVFLFQKLKYPVELHFDNTSPEETLYFMPHAPLELTNVILINEKPHHILANNIISHTDRFTKLKLHETYPIIALLVKLTESESNNGPNDDGFSKPKKRRNKLTYTEPKIDYDFNHLDCYFDKVEIVPFKQNFNKSDPWGTSFSDLAYHVIGTKKTE